jgi:hypothetical protein
MATKKFLLSNIEFANYQFELEIFFSVQIIGFFQSLSLDLHAKNLWHFKSHVLWSGKQIQAKKGLQHSWHLSDVVNHVPPFGPRVPLPCLHASFWRLPVAIAISLLH